MRKFELRQSFICSCHPVRAFSKYNTLGLWSGISTTCLYSIKTDMNASRTDRLILAAILCMATRPIGQKYMLKLKRHIRCGHRHFLQQLARLENNQTENPARLSAEIQESIMANRQRTETYLDMDRELRRLDGYAHIMLEARKAINNVQRIESNLAFDTS